MTFQNVLWKQLEFIASFSCLSLPLLIKSIIGSSFMYQFTCCFKLSLFRRVFHLLLQHDVWVGLSELHCSHIGHSYNQFRHDLILCGIWVDLSELHYSRIGHSCSECHHDLSLHALLDGFFVLLWNRIGNISCCIFIDFCFCILFIFLYYFIVILFIHFFYITWMLIFFLMIDSFGRLYIPYPDCFCTLPKGSWW